MFSDTTDLTQDNNGNDEFVLLRINRAVEAGGRCVLRAWLGVSRHLHHSTTLHYTILHYTTLCAWCVETCSSCVYCIYLNVYILILEFFSFLNVTLNQTYLNCTRLI